MAEKYIPTPAEEQLLKETIVTYWGYGNRSQERARLNKEVLDKLIALGERGKDHWTLVNVRQWWKNHQKKYCPDMKVKPPKVAVRDQDRAAILRQSDFVSPHMNLHAVDGDFALHPPDPHHTAPRPAPVLRDLMTVRPPPDTFPEVNPVSNPPFSGFFDRIPSGPFDLGKTMSNALDFGRTSSGFGFDLGRNPSGGSWDLTRGASSTWDLTRNTTGTASGLFADTTRQGDNTTKTGDGLSRENSNIFSRSPFSGSLSKWTSSFIGYPG